MKKVLVIGDTLLDRYFYGDVKRISPEAPVPVLQYSRHEQKLGGACNVAANIRTLSKNDHNIEYFGAGNQDIVSMLKEYSIKFGGVSSSKETILQKIRYVANNHHLLRMDRGERYSKSQILVGNKLLKGFDLNEYSMIVISDYDKGTFDEEVAEYIFENYKGYILIDLKKYQTWLPNFDLSRTIVKCNEKEFTENKVDMLLYSNVMYIVKTLGSRGFYIMKSYKENEWKHRPSIKLEGNVVDVVGAGDTFLAGMVAQFLDSGEFDIEAMTEWGNKAAAKKVQKFGTNTISHEEIE